MVWFERFRYEVIGPFFHRFDGSFNGAVSSNHNNRDIVFPASNFAEHINAVHIGHLDIKENQLWILPFQKLQPHFRRLGRKNPIPQRLKTISKHLADIAIIINDEDVTGKRLHHSSSRLMLKTFWILAFNSTHSKGFRRYSLAPLARASIAASRLDDEVIMMTGIFSPLFRISSRASIPPISGILTSMNTPSNFSTDSFFRASKPVPAVITVNPQASNRS